MLSHYPAIWVWDRPVQGGGCIGVQLLSDGLQTAILLAFIATSLSGAALGQTAPAAPIVSDVPGAAVLGDVPVAEETERGLFLGVGRHG